MEERRNVENMTDCQKEYFSGMCNEFEERVHWYLHLPSKFMRDLMTTLSIKNRKIT